MAFARLLAGLAVSLLMFGSPSATRAADPSPEPSPLVFNTPQYLVWMDGHSTYNGPVEDNAYWLYVAPPNEDGVFHVPDGTGGVFIYTGRLVAGPFIGEADACPAMLAVGVTSLQAWIVYAGEDAQIADCSRYLATDPPAEPVGTEAPPVVGGLTGGSDIGGDDPVDPASLGLAAALIGFLLFGGGALLGIGTGVRPVPAVASGPAVRPDGNTSTQHEPTQDPCAGQAEAVARASATGRYINGLLASCRRYEAMLQEQIDTLANLVLPGSVLLDLGFAAGGLSGGLGGVLGRKLLASATFRAAVGESVAKDVAKELAKQALGSAGGGLDAGNAAAEGTQSAIKQSVLEAVGEGIVNRHFFDSIHPTAPTRVFRDVGEYSGFMKELEGYAADVAGPIKDGMGAMIDLYQGVSSGLELKDRLDRLRALRDRIADKRVDLEMQFETSLENQQFAADRLAHCRAINVPGWRP
ncbi:MAG: hypothetical protein AABZ33_11925 [Chloroflexota bacterium]